MSALSLSALASYWVGSSFRRKSPALTIWPSRTPILIIRPGTWALMLMLFFGLTAPEAEMIEVRSWGEVFSTVALTDFSLREVRLAMTMTAIKRQITEIMMIFLRLGLGRGALPLSGLGGFVFLRQMMRYLMSNPFL